MLQEVVSRLAFTPIILPEYEKSVVPAGKSSPVVTRASWTTGSRVEWLQKKLKRSAPVLGVASGQSRMPSTKLLFFRIDLH